MPGLGKTLLVRTLAEALDLQLQPHPVHARPDAGRHHRHEHHHGRRPTAAASSSSSTGPIFAQIVLADEINRATPKTQSALLEAMQEHSVTVGGTIHQLKEPFFVMATQNPIEQEGTYPLPEAQLDRFFFKLVVGYSSREELDDDPRPHDAAASRPQAEKVMDGDEIVQWQQLVREVIIAPHVQDYAIRLTLATHPDGPFAADVTNQYLRWGAQPARGADARAGRQGAGPARRPLQRQLRGHPPRLPAQPAAPRDPELRGPGRGDRARRRPPEGPRRRPREGRGQHARRQGGMTAAPRFGYDESREVCPIRERREVQRRNGRWVRRSLEVGVTIVMLSPRDTEQSASDALHAMHDIYDPPPAPISWNPPKPEPLVFTTGDLVCLVTLCLVLVVAAMLAWTAEPAMAMVTALGRLAGDPRELVHGPRLPASPASLGLRARWTVFLAALVPWLVGLGVAATLMLGLFLVSDWLV